MFSSNSCTCWFSNKEDILDIHGRSKVAYSFMLRPIMAEEEAVFRCSSKAEAASAKRFCQYAKEPSCSVKITKVQKGKKIKRTLERRVTSHTILNRVIIEFLVGLLAKPEFLRNEEDNK